MYSYLLIAVILLYLKWILIILFYPLQATWGLFQRNRQSKFYLILAFPYWAVEHFLRFGGGRFLLFNISTIPSNRIRKWLYKGLGAEISHNVIIHFKTEIRAPYFLSIGEGTIIGDNALLDARNRLTFGRNINLSSNVSIYTEQHDYRDPYFACTHDKDMRVKIDDKAWIGANVIVLPGVHIGEGAVCCAGCVVTKDVEPYAVMAGIPAKKISERPRCLKYEFNGKACRLY